MRKLRVTIGLTLLSSALGLGILACGEGDEGGPLMKPGKACLNCHAGGEETFSFAGTVFAAADGSAPAEGVTVVVTDAGGTEVSVTSNGVGNFYSERSLTPPFQVVLTLGADSKAMTSPASTGNCNDCHSAGGGAGRLVMP